MTESKLVFDSKAFFRALETTVQARGMKWKDVSTQTGVGTSTLSRMAQGRGPDSSSLANLAAWAGLNPADFVRGQNRAAHPEPLAVVAASLRRDPRLSKEAAEAMEELIKATYSRLAKRGGV